MIFFIYLTVPLNYNSCFPEQFLYVMNYALHPEYKLTRLLIAGKNRVETAKGVFQLPLINIHLNGSLNQVICKCLNGGAECC